MFSREKENEDLRNAGSAEHCPDSSLPQLYTFKLRKPSNGYNTSAPPFYVQLDNAIAVVWALFGPNMPLGEDN